MEKVLKLNPIEPRFLRYRSHYRAYVIGFVSVSILIIAFWFFRIAEEGIARVWREQIFELLISFLYFTVFGSFYFLWLRPRLNRSVQVFEDHLLIHNNKVKEEIQFSEIESVSVICWSVFYFKMKNGIKYYFNSSLERVDYIWEGVHNARPELISQEEFEAFRLKLIQYDHHQKRKEWFFKHKMVDVFNWLFVPVFFLLISFIYQSKSIEIHQQGLYFFRLLMFSLIILLSTSFFYSIVLKKLIFDKKIAEQFEQSSEKIRDLEFEGVVLQRSKIFQVLTSCFVLAVMIKLDANFYSITKVKEDIASFNLKKGHTLVVDNRYNCVGCRYQLNDGDLVIFGRGLIGQILAKEGDMVGEVAQDRGGRTIASENIQEVPKGHVAIKSSNGKDILFIKIGELIGKIQK